MDHEPLSTLLEERADISAHMQRLLQDLRASIGLRYTDTLVVPTEQIAGIYSVRASINARRPEPKILGFEELIENLDRECDDKVALHTVVTDRIMALVFTDVKATRIIGALVFPDATREDFLCYIDRQNTNS